MLFQGLEGQLNLPPVLLNGRDGVSSESEVVGEQNYFSLVFAIPNNYFAQDVRAVFLSIEAIEADELI